MSNNLIHETRLLLETVHFVLISVTNFLIEICYSMRKKSARGYRVLWWMSFPDWRHDTCWVLSSKLMSVVQLK